jgi:hypothetical protein
MPGVYHRMDHLKPAKVGKRWESLPQSNDVAYYDKSYLVAVKRFIKFALDGTCIYEV